jgi:Raf kinase inhibitor-like YbhB/YbcL family protein
MTMTEEVGDVPLALQRVVAHSERALRVSSQAIGGAIPRAHSEYGDGLSPDISWERVDGAKSYVLILEDPDSHHPRPFVHWVAFNIPADVISLRAGLQEQPRLDDPKGMLQGRNSRGATGYFGPRPPVGEGPHHYHFQVFALDIELNVPPGADRDEVIVAMSNHVLAAGELVGTYQQATAPHSSPAYRA